MYCGFEYTFPALRSRLVKIPSLENDFLFRGKTAKGIEKKEREREKEERRRGERRGEVTTQISRNGCKDNRAATFSPCRSALHRAHFIRVFTEQPVITANPSRPRYLKEINFTSLPR